MSHEQRYRPRAEFRDQLEWELMTSYRRAERAERGTVTRARPATGWMKAAVIVITSVALGATAGLASAQLRSSSERDSLLAAARADAMLASMRRDIARAQADDVTLKVRAGAEDQLAADRADAELQAMEMQLARVSTNMEEINASGRAPRDDLNAPLVDGHDFVKRRIEIDGVAAQAQLKAAEGTQQNIERRARAGVATEVERLAAAADVARAKGALSVIAAKLQLRAEFVAKGTPVEELARRLDKAQVTQDAYVAQQELTLARARLDVAVKQRRLGIVDDVQVLRAQLDVAQRNLELSRLASRLKTP
jgi:hypothetical protein